MTTHGPSFLRWAGSKRKSLALLSAQFNDQTRHYIEPFAGSAALFFALSPKSVTLGDLNGHLVNTLRQVRDDPHTVYEKLNSIERNASSYYEVRKLFNTLPRYGIDAAASFLYLNRNCFNGLWRTNRSGAFNVPYGGSEMGSYPPLALFLKCSNLLKLAKIRHQDFRKTIKEATENSFIYVDPPYFVSQQRVFVEYGKKSFGKDDLSDLIYSLCEAERRGAQIAFTYYDDSETDGIPKHWRKVKFSVTRNVGGFSGSRKIQSEALYTNVKFKGYS